jgi:hypothetical protein
MLLYSLRVMRRSTLAAFSVSTQGSYIFTKLVLLPLGFGLQEKKEEHTFLRTS